MPGSRHGNGRIDSHHAGNAGVQQKGQRQANAHRSACECATTVQAYSTASRQGFRRRRERIQPLRERKDKASVGAGQTVQNFGQASRSVSGSLEHERGGAGARQNRCSTRDNEGSCDFIQAQTARRRQTCPRLATASAHCASARNALSSSNRFQETAMTLKGKTLFITGASRGIGLAIAK